MSALPPLHKQPSKNLSSQPQLNHRYEIDLKNYKVKKRINIGADGVVYLVENVLNKEQYAAKVIFCSGKEEEYDNVLNREVEIMMNTNHATLVQFIGFSKVDFTSEKNVTIIMELSKNGSLKDVLTKLKKNPTIISNTIRQIIITGIARGMKYLHDHSIIHRDLKPMNVLIDENYHPQIADFSRSKRFEFGHSSDQSQVQGTYFYAAPEVLKGDSYNRKADVFSFAMILYEVVTGNDLFPEMTLKTLNDVVYNGIRPKFDVPVKEDIKQLIEQCWLNDPNERPTFKQIFNKLASSIIHQDDIKGDYLLDGVDINEFHHYVDEITQNHDPVENLVQEIDLYEKEVQKLKDERKKLIDENQERKAEIKELKLKKDTISRNLNLLNKQLTDSVNDNQNYVKKINMYQDVFNSLPLLKQGQIIEIIMSSENRQLEQFFQKISKLIRILLKFKESEEHKCIEIENDPKQEESNVQIMADATEILYKNKLFSSSEFIGVLSSFSNLSMEIKYPSPNFQEIYDMIVKFKKNIKSDLKIGVYINTIKKTGIDFHNYENINIARLNKSMTAIKRSNNNFGCFQGCEQLFRVLIPPSIRSIGLNAFYQCSRLSEIKIPSSVTIIDNYAFYMCSSLTQIEIPSSVNLISSFAFYGCSSLVQIKNYSSVTLIEKHVFSGCSSLKQIAIPSSVTSIGDHAFSECSSLAEIAIPSSVTSIGCYTFLKCKSLTQIEIPSSVTSIYFQTFYSCTSLAQIKIPSSVTSIGSATFFECTSLTQIEIPSSVTSIYSKAFYKCTSLAQIKIPSSVTSINESAFSGCSSLKQIEIPSSVTEIANNTFYECGALSNITIHPHLKSIGDYAFYFCSSLISITIPPSVTSIGKYAFQNCSSLKHILIQSQIKEIKSFTFGSCRSIEQFQIPPTVETICSFAFCDCQSLFKIEIPPNVTKIEQSAFCKCNSLVSISLPKSVKTIEFSAFQDCKKLAQIKIPSSLKKIGPYAFHGCPLTTKHSFSSYYYEFGPFAYFDDFENLNELRYEERNAKRYMKETNEKLLLNFYDRNRFKNLDEFFLLVKKIMIKLPNIIPVKYICLPLTISGYSNQYYAIVTDCAKNGSIYEFLYKGLYDHTHNNLNLSIIIFGVACTMKKLHQKNIIHYLLNIDNVFLDENLEPIIGLMKIPYEEFNDDMIEKYYLNPFYFYGNDIGNEIIKKLGYEKEIDIISFAFFVYFLYCDKYELKNSIWKNEMIFIHQYELGWRPGKPNNIPYYYWDLIESCWDPQLDDLPTFEDITNILKKNEFIVGDEEQVREYQKRIDIDE